VPCRNASGRRLERLSEVTPPPTRTLYRAVGPPELERIRASGGRAFPMRGHHEPVFSMASSEARARAVVREWLVEGRSGYVIRFELEADWCDRHVSAAPDGDPWVATEAIPALNAHLVGEIRMLAALRPPPPMRTRS